MIGDGVADRVEVASQWAGRGCLLTSVEVYRGSETRFRGAFLVSLGGV